MGMNDESLGSAAGMNRVSSVDLTTQVGDWVLDNPVIPASGCFGFGYEFAEYYDLSVLGSISLKGTTREARYGNPCPRIAEATAGLLNAVGLQNPGVEAVCREELPRLAACYPKKVIANISGFSFDEYLACCERMDEEEQIALLEINISCPNVKGGGLSFGTDPSLAAELTAAIKRRVKTPICVKLSPNVTDIAALAKACEAAGADALSLVNTFLGMRLDLKARRPLLANLRGGLSGPAIFPLALRMVYDVAAAVSIPVIGMGGIDSAERVLEMLAAGATAVQVGAANLTDPLACPTMIRELPAVLERYGFASVREAVAAANPEAWEKRERGAMQRAGSS